jgi:uncharacterized hydrophobic protein (TIGR00271 family)
MRRLVVQVRRGEGERVMQLASEHEAANFTLQPATGSDGELDLVTAYLTNRSVGPFIDAISDIPEMRATLTPRGVIALEPPAGKAPGETIDIEFRSPIEILLAGLQSVGSWRGFLSYAALAGVVAWIGLYTGTVYLLTAAMLLAPFAGPAMNLAIGTARGDAALIRKSLGRYFAALGVTIAVAAILSLLMGQQIATPQMVERSQVSSVALLLALAAGAAGALNVAQSERSSLVSGAAVGILVAASLAPPAGLTGMALVIGEPEMAASGFFVLLLQLVGINLSGAVVFRIVGISSEGTRYERGRRWLFPLTTGLTIAGLVALLTIQFWQEPYLIRSSLAQDAASDVREAIDQSGVASVVEANVRFTRADVEEQHSLLVELFLQKRNPDASEQEVRERINQIVGQTLRQRNLTPLTSIHLVEPAR